ncbi:MAG: hypothetical protein EOP64_00020 [Sphingomonas sp.]|nr:MAG: hypothetical protein EOP64_00020 [Sphingomonas sp.]
MAHSWRALALCSIALVVSGYGINNPSGDIQAVGGGGGNGQPGPPGPAGMAGNTVLTVSMAPTPVLGQNGDYAYNPTTQTIYGPKQDGIWSSVGTVLKGSKGDKGDDGGRTILNGVGAPDFSVGSPNDFYLDTAATQIYGPKSSVGWPQSGISLVGQKGDRGDVGPAGADSVVPGPKGDKGDPGRMGLDGNSIVGPAGPAGADSTVPGPKGDKGDPGQPGKDGNSIVGPSGPAGADSTVPGPAGPMGLPGRDGNSIVGPPGPAGADSTVAGPPGPAGAMGTIGIAGKDGRTIYNGMGAPASALGDANDLYYDTQNIVLYGPRTPSAWPTPGISLRQSAGNANVMFPLLAPNSPASMPQISFAQSPNTGLALSAANTLDISTNAVSALNISPSQVATFSGPVSVANQGSNHLTLNANGSTTGMPTLQTVGTFSTAANYSKHFRWQMNQTNAANGVNTPAYMMSLGASGASAPNILSWDNVAANRNIFKYDDTALLWTFSGSQAQQGNLTVAGASTFNGPVAFNGTVTGLPSTANSNDLIVGNSLTLRQPAAGGTFNTYIDVAGTSGSGAFTWRSSGTPTISITGANTSQGIVSLVLSPLYGGGSNITWLPGSSLLDFGSNSLKTAATGSAALPALQIGPAKNGVFVTSSGLAFTSAVKGGTVGSFGYAVFGGASTQYVAVGDETGSTTAASRIFQGTYAAGPNGTVYGNPGDLYLDPVTPALWQFTAANGNSGWVKMAIAGGTVSYPLLAPDGSIAAPQYSFSADSSFGHYRFVDGNGNKWFTFTQNGYTIGDIGYNTSGYSFLTLSGRSTAVGIGSGVVPPSAVAAGLSSIYQDRQGQAFIKTALPAGWDAIQTQSTPRPTLVRNGDLTLTAAQSGTFFSNYGTSTVVNFTLPTGAPIGTWFEFVADVPTAFTVTAPGDSYLVLRSANTTPNAGAQVNSTSVTSGAYMGDTCRVVLVNNRNRLRWVVIPGGGSTFTSVNG